MSRIRIQSRITVYFLLTFCLLLSVSSAGALNSRAGTSIAKDNGFLLSSEVSSKFTYQGRLTDTAGNPLSGSFNMTFRIWDDPLVGGQIGGDIVKNSVPVEDGLFSVELSVPHSAFNGQALWLETIVDGVTLSPRQELAAVPYALSLKPGAEVIGESGDTLTVQSWNDNGLYGVTANVDKSGVYGYSHLGTGVKGRSEGNTGVVGWTGNAGDASGVLGHSTTAVGVRGRSDQSHGVVGWTGGADFSGVMGQSDAGNGVHGSSTGRHGVVGVSTSSNTAHAGIYAENDDGPAVYAMGDLLVTGAFRGEIGPNSGASFPRPAFDSGWISCDQPNPPITIDTVMPPSEGYQHENFVIDYMAKWSGWTYVPLGGITCFVESNNNLTCDCTTDWDEYRIRIWYYK